MTSSNSTPTSEEIHLRDIEQDVIKRFSIKLDALALQWNVASYAGSALGSQDTVFADYLLATDTRFCLIEFKATKGNFGSENRKALRIKLFERLAERKDLLRRSLDMHYMCWGTEEHDWLPGISEPVLEENEMLGQYVPCIASYMPTKLTLDDADEYRPETFVEHFFASRQFGSDLKRFKRYLDELAKLAVDAKEDGNTLEGVVCVYNAALAKFKSYRFIGIRHLMAFLNSPSQTPTQQKSSRKTKPKSLGM